MNILIFGESIVSGKADLNGGWVNYLSAYLQKNTINKKGAESIDIYNLAINGDTSKGLASRIATDIKPRISKQKTLVLVSIGLNDSRFKRKTSKNQTSLNQYKKYLKTIVRKNKRLRAQVIFIGPTPADENKTDPISWRKDGFSYLNSEILKYNNAMKEVAENNKLKFIDLFGKLDKKYIKTLGDGLHPDSKGHKMIFELLKNKIK